MAKINKYGTGSEMEIVYAIETTEGSVPTTGTVKELICGPETFDALQPTNFNNDVTSDGMKGGTIRDLNRLTGGFSGQYEDGAHQDFDLGLLGRKSFTTDTYDDTIDIVGAGDGLTATITFSGSVSISGMIANGPIKLGSLVDSTQDGIYRVNSVSSSTGTVVVGLIDPKNQDFTGLSETGTAATISQRYAKNGGVNPNTFTFEKRGQQVNTDNVSLRLSGEKVNSGSYTSAIGQGLDVAYDFIGLGDTRADDGMIGPNGWLVDGAFSAGVTTIDIKSGSTEPAAGDYFYLTDDDTSTRYTVVSYSSPAVVFTPALGDDVSTDTKLYCARPGTNEGSGTKFEDILSYTTVDGTSQCIMSSTLNFANNLSPIECSGNDSVVSTTFGERQVTGTFEAHFDTNIQPTLTKIYNGDTLELVRFFRDKDGNVMSIQLPQVVADKELVKRADMNKLMQNIPFKAEKDQTLETNAIIHYIEA